MLHQDVQKLVKNCSSLQKLSLAYLKLDSEDIEYICQNNQTLQVLDLEECNFYLLNLTEDLFTNCTQLTEVSICFNYRSVDNESIGSKLLDPYIQALVDNLTPRILKVNLRGEDNLHDEHVKKLVKRCNNITHLDLSDTSITNDSVCSIIEKLKASLEKLDVSYTNVDFATLLQLRSMPALKTLICFDPYYGDEDSLDEDDPDDDHTEDIENLKQQFPHIRINEQKKIYIAEPFKINAGPRMRYALFKLLKKFSDFGWTWEIKAKLQDLFAKVEDDDDDSNDSDDSDDE